MFNSTYFKHSQFSIRQQPLVQLPKLIAGGMLDGWLRVKCQLKA